MADEVEWRAVAQTFGYKPELQVLLCYGVWVLSPSGVPELGTAPEGAPSRPTWSSPEEAG